MRAWLLDQIGGGIGSLRLGEAEDPAPAPGEAIVEVALAALNPADRYTAEGQYPAKPALPHILGRDGVGVISAVGPGVVGHVGEKRIIVRSEVGISRRGTLAERVAVPVESLVPVPEGWSDEQSAGATLVYLTAWQSFEVWPDLPPSGAVVLVSGASGGVGVAVTHLASAMGHTVIGLSRSEEKSAELRRQGASITLDPTDDGWVKRLKEQLGKQRVDLAVDNVGGRLFPQLIETLGENGRVSCVGRLVGPVPEFNTATLFFRRIQIRGIGVYTYRPEQSAAIWPKIVALLNRKHYRPLVDRVFDFEALPAAFERLRAGPMGKVLIQVKETKRRRDEEKE